ncbi:hypothetical protein J8J40_30275, partial [Mycobacterium tuberculosis]|nr:hypothetical protein [Mycobacterium tuberculosis]
LGAAGALALLAAVWRQRALLLPEFVFAAAVAAVALSAGRMMSLPRVLGVLFPLMLVVPLLVRSARGRLAVLAVAGFGNVALMLVLF